MALFAFTSRPVMTIEEGRSAVDPDPADSVANPIEAAALDD
jgi:hypothetical protein